MSRRRTASLVVLAVIVISLVVLMLSPTAGIDFDGGDAVALIRLSGSIEDSPGASLLGAGAITPALVAERLTEAEEDQRVKAVVLRINSPGGSVAASQEIAALLEAFAKPVVVSMGDVVASGGYYVAARADHIVAQPGTLTGGIGVIWPHIDPQGLLDELGIEVDAVTAGEHKDMFLPGKLSPEQRRILKGIVDGAHRHFIETVAQGRGISEAELEDLATGEPFSGEDAATMGLIDEVGGEEDALEAAESLAGITDARIVEFTPSFFERLFSGSALRSGQQPDIPVVTDPLQQRIALLRELLLGFNQPRYEVP
jgi:protease IV